MSRVSIFEKKWIDLVFEGKNKEYGAYQLRQENSRTTLVAFFIGTIFLSGFVFALSSFAKPTEVLPEVFNPNVVIKVDNFNPTTKKEPEHKLPAAKKTEVTDEVKKEDLKNPLIAQKDEKFVDVKTNEETKKAATTSENGVEGGTGTSKNTSDGEGKTGTSTITETKKLEGTVITALLDKQPEYPGGINKFYEYVGNNFEKPEMDETENSSVYVAFVIEKDGSMTDVKVLRNPGYGLGKEAIRVLKSLRTKWKPGIKDGQPVRTQFTLPIIVKKG